MPQKARKKGAKDRSAVDTAEPLHLETKKSSVISKRVISMRQWSLKPEDKMIMGECVAQNWQQGVSPRRART